MKNKLSKLHILWAFAVLLSSSCSSLLEEDVKSALNEQQAYGSIPLLKQNALLSIYNYIGGNSNSNGLQGTDRGVYDLNSFTTDEQIIPTRGSDWYDGGLWQRLFLHTWTAGEGPLKDTWDYLFKMVMLCNEGIERMEAYVTTDPVEQDQLLCYASELKALRAMYYYYLMDLYGRIPLVTSTTARSSELVLSERSTTYHWIIDQLLEALPYLSYFPSQSEESEYYGRMTYSVAEFLLAKLALNAEVYDDDDWTDGQRPDGSQIYFQIEEQRLNAWETVDYFCSELGRHYSLMTFYVDNFIPGNSVSTENIFTIPMNPMVYGNVYNYFFRSRHYSHGAALGGASENGPCATVSTMQAFGYHNDPDVRINYNFYFDEVIENQQTVYEDDGTTPLVYYPMAVTSIDLTGSKYEKTAGARLAKYPHDPTSRADGRMGNNDIVLFRYADALLMRAEALLHLGETTEATACYNQVRERVSSSVADTVTFGLIYRERLLELMWEGWRRNDMIRFGTFCQAYDLKRTIDHEADGHTIVFPIPDDLIAMHPSWEQNPGY